MKYFLDNIIFSIQRAGGISCCWQELIARAISDSDLKPLFLLSYPGSEANLSYQKLPDLSRHQYRNLRSRVVPLFLERLLPVNLSRNSLFHSSYYRYASGKNIFNVVTVHDCVYERFGSSLGGKMTLALKARALKVADVVICVSQNTADDVLQYYDFVDPSIIRVIYNGVGATFYPLNENIDCIEINGRRLRKYTYLLYVGKRNGYKNFDSLIEALILMKKNKIDLPFVVVVGGERCFTSDQQAMVRNSNLQDLFIGVDKCPNELLNRLYNYALAYVCTSRYEGFGLPIIEAMKAGCPVISANNSSLRELAHDVGLLYNNIGELIDSIKAVTRNDVRNQIIKKGGVRSAQFSWDRAYKETKEIYLS